MLTTFGGETGMWEKERKARRVPAVEPVSGSFTNGGIHEVSGVTRDVSPAGAFFYCEIAPEVGSEIELVFSLRNWSKIPPRCCAGGMSCASSPPVAVPKSVLL
jgi:hypothetical protein